MVLLDRNIEICGTYDDTTKLLLPATILNL